MSDVDIGGISESKLDWVPCPPGTAPPSPLSPGYARFHGNISNQLPKNRPDVHRTGYAAFRTRDRPPTIFGRSVFNIDPYVYLALRVKSDGRSYFVNVQTESIVPTDLHQHRLFVKKPGEWETVLIKWNDFVRTNLGYVVEPQAEILRQKVRSIGIGLTDRVPGPFELFIERIWATNDESEADNVVDLSRATAQSVVAEARPLASPESASASSLPASPPSARPIRRPRRAREAAAAAEQAKLDEQATETAAQVTTTKPAVEGKLKTKQGQKVAWTKE